MDATPERVEEIRREAGLDRNLAVRYVERPGGVATGDRGRSSRARRACGRAYARLDPRVRRERAHG